MRIAAFGCCLAFILPPVSAAAGEGGADAITGPAAAVQPGSDARPVVFPAEFEHQDAIVLGWDATEEESRRVVLQIIGRLWKSVPLIVLLSGDNTLNDLEAAVARARIPQDGIHVIKVPFDTAWVRDYGPQAVRRPDGLFQLVDGDYDRLERLKDDAVTRVIARRLGMSRVSVPLTMEGGNLLTNGAGLCLSTNSLVAANERRNFTEADVARLLRQHYGATQALFLEPLLGEASGHVDVFATFTSVDTVVVGEYPAETESLNSQVLDRNAARLAGLATPRGPLKVVRIPMPPAERGIVRSYTNVLYANGTVLVPVYAGDENSGRTAALAVYRELLPGWNVVPIDCGELIKSGGALHCISLNLPRVAKLPGKR